jgi:imidazole glycerol-phosphate synthase subunit HisH
MIAVIKYNAGNIKSLSFALERLGVDFKITGVADEIVSADKVIFPGVGEASSTMSYLREHKLDQVIKNLKQPLLGICLGMQLMCKFSEENKTECLGIFDEQVKLIPGGGGLKVPHIGWNKLQNLSGWLGKLPVDGYAYFVHSYYVPVNEFTTASCGYGVEISAAMQRHNFYALQFHPEKSADEGAEILKTFLDL